MLNSAVCFIATASAAAGGVSWLLTFTPWTQFMSPGYSVPFFYLTFPLFGWSVFVLTFVRRPDRYRRQRIDLVKEIPCGSRIPFVLLLVAVWATSLAAMTSLPGQPEYEPGLRRYVYDEGGVLIPATRAAYLHAVTVQNRLFLGAALLFTSAAVAGETAGGWPPLGLSPLDTISKNSVGRTRFELVTSSVSGESSLGLELDLEASETP
jgi:hypothetical protein